MPEAATFAVMPPSIPGLGTQGGFSFWLQDRTGGSLDFLNQNVQKFLEAARKRPELVGVTTQFTAAVPQLYADVDRDKVLKQGIALGDVYQTMQAFLGGLYVNQFNRFGRQWRVFLQAEGGERRSPTNIGQFYVRNNDGSMVPLSTLESTKPAFGPQYTNRFNVYRAALITGAAAPGYSSGQALDVLEQVARETMPKEISYDWSDLSYQEKKAGGSGPLFALSIAFVFLILAALYESWSLPFSVLLSVPIAVFGAVVGLLHPHVRLRRLRADRRDHADRPRGQERDSDRRVRQGAARRRQEPGGRCARGRETAAAPDSDDVVRVHPRLRAAVVRERFGRGLAPHSRHRRRHRHARGHAARRFHHSAAVRAGRAVVAPQVATAPWSAPDLASGEGRP